MTINLAYFFLLNITLFFIGLTGVIINRKHILIILISLELLLLAVGLNFILGSLIFHDAWGKIITLFILTVAAAESAIGLGLIFLYYHIRGDVYIESFNFLKG